MKSLSFIISMLLLAFAANAQMYEIHLSNDEVVHYSSSEVNHISFSTDVFEVSSTSLSFDYSANSSQLTITCNNSWSASSSQSWCTVSPASGTGNGNLTIAVTQNGSTYSRSASVTLKSGTLTKTITVTQRGRDMSPIGAEAVDLGLPSGTLWANMNVGATSPEDYGDYFAWGETTPQSENVYSWTSYKWCNDASDNLTKYCNKSDYGYNGFTDTKTVLDAEDDAATANWGGEWRMPTYAECQELIDNTTNEWTTWNGVYGRKFTSKTNSNSIFLPAAGYRWDGELFNTGSYGYYWSSMLLESNPSRAWYLYFSSGGVYTGNYYRGSGRSVRPVRQN